MSLFVDDLAGFLKDDLSITNFLKLIEDYGTCSGLKGNPEKSDLLGQHSLTSVERPSYLRSDFVNV